MKKTVKKIIAGILNPVLSKIGYVQRSGNAIPKDYLLKTFYGNIKAMGFSPKHIIDIGANHGTWTRETLKYFPDAYFTMLEPQHWLQPSFQDLLDANKKIAYHAVGAGPQPGSFKFTIADRDDSCSFRYSEAEALEKGFKQVDVPIVTLDDLVKTSDFPFPDIVKIDAEGLDIDVLKGASSLFGKTEIFMVEAGIVNKEFDNSVLKMAAFMDGKGYRLFEITDLNRVHYPPVLWLVELVFVKKGGLIDSYQFN